MACCVQNGGDNPGKPSPEVGQDLADVVAAGAERGKEGVADGAFQSAACEASVGFHVADFSFYCASAAEVCDEFWCQASSGAADQNAGPCLSVAAIAAVDDGQIGALVGQDFHLFQRVPQGVAIGKRDAVPLLPLLI